MNVDSLIITTIADVNYEREQELKQTIKRCINAIIEKQNQIKEIQRQLELVKRTLSELTEVEHITVKSLGLGD